MGENSKIEWTDHTFNPWIGCTKVSPGCANCYAEARDRRHLIENVNHWGKGAPRLRTSAANWKGPLKWNRTHPEWQNRCDPCGLAFRDPENLGNPWCCPNCNKTLTSRRARVFCASQADWLDDEVPIEWLADLLALIYATPNLDWLLLTKRPENFFKRLGATPYSPFIDRWLSQFAPANVWLGTSVEDQKRADERIPALLAIPAHIRFLSCEPLLGPLSIPLWLSAKFGRLDAGFREVECPQRKLHWVICGGESGPGARPMHPEWARSLRDQCQAAGVPFFFKQWGEWGPCEPINDARATQVAPGMQRVGKKAAGRLLDGRTWDEVPLQNSEHFVNSVGSPV